MVMRVRIEDPNSARDPGLKWRGVALDEFTGTRVEKVFGGTALGTKNQLSEDSSVWARLKHFSG